jgi:hypothetical protein
MECEGTGVDLDRGGLDGRMVMPTATTAKAFRVSRLLDSARYAGRRDGSLKSSSRAFRV